MAFDSRPSLIENFTTQIDAAASAIVALKQGDNDAAILDSLGFAVGLLRDQPPEYRRAILLVSETLDREQHLDDRRSGARVERYQHCHLQHRIFNG